MLTSFPKADQGMVLDPSFLTVIDLDAQGPIVNVPWADPIPAGVRSASPRIMFLFLTPKLDTLLPLDKKGNPKQFTFLMGLRKRAENSEYFKRAADLFAQKEQDLLGFLFPPGSESANAQKALHQQSVAFRLDGVFLHQHPDEELFQKGCGDAINSGDKPRLVPGECRVEGCTATMILTKSPFTSPSNSVGAPVGVHWTANINTVGGTHYGYVQNSSMGLCEEHYRQRVLGLYQSSRWVSLVRRKDLELYLTTWMDNEEPSELDYLAALMEATKESEVEQIESQLSGKDFLENVKDTVKGGKAVQNLHSDKLLKTCHVALYTRKSSKIPKLGTVLYLREPQAKLIENLRAFHKRFHHTPLCWIIEASLGFSYQRASTAVDWQRWINRMLHGGPQNYTEGVRVLNLCRKDLLLGTSLKEFGTKRRLWLLEDWSMGEHDEDKLKGRETLAFKFGTALAEAAHAVSWKSPKRGEIREIASRTTQAPLILVSQIDRIHARVSRNPKEVFYENHADEYARLLRECHDLIASGYISPTDQGLVVLGFQERNLHLKEVAQMKAAEAKAKKEAEAAARKAAPVKEN